jgi:hypothetical protein
MTLNTARPSYYGDYYGYYTHAFALSHASTQVYNYREFEIETNLYDVKSRQLIWSGRQRITDERSDDSNLQGLVDGLLSDLFRKGFL